MLNQNIRDLLDRYLSGQCSAEEILQVEAWLKAQENQDNEWEKMAATEKEVWINRLYNNIRQRVELNNVDQKSKSIVVRFNTRWWTRIAAAAIVIFIAGAGIRLFFFNKSGNKIPREIVKKPPLPKEILAGGNKAILTLADGSTVILDSAQNGLVAKQGATTVIKLNGRLNYNSASSSPSAVTYNTITTPAGGTYQVELPDGSMVWLNAASSLHFPTSFSAGERKVEINGEAYFEVAKNKKLPFIVKLASSEIRVLGTHFNVMDYKNESSVKTTLLEGAVKFVSGNDSSFLQPGQQLQLFDNGRLNLIKEVDVQDVIAWKEGFFHFEGADLETVMRQLARWYDIELTYENTKTDNLFYMEMPRTTKLIDILKVLELSSGVHFKIEGKNVRVVS